MRSCVFVTCLTLAGVGAAGAQDAVTPAAAPPIAIACVTILDVAAGVDIPAQTVVVREDRIERVGAAQDVTLPADAVVIDGRGFYLMPGLCDAHAHYLDPLTFGPLYIANGVTLVRDMGMPNAIAFAQRDDLDTGRLLGPELRASGTMLDGSPPLIPVLARAVTTPEEARDAVRDQQALGADFIKVYSRLDAATFRALLDEARSRGLKVAGHVPDAVPIEDAAEAGLSSCEHLFGFDKLIGRLLGMPVHTSYVGMGADVSTFLRLDEVDPEALGGALRDLRDHGITVCPTVVTFRAGMQTRAFQTGEFAGREFASETLVGTWRALWAAQSDLLPFVWEAWSRLVAQLHAAGIPLMVGTDLSVPGILPGFSVHDEMEIWQAAGIPAGDILRSAITVPAAWLGLDARLGAVAEGMTASMVLLRANPLDDVANARAIEGVFLRGRHFDRPALDQLLAEARQAARQ